MKDFITNIIMEVLMNILKRVFADKSQDELDGILSEIKPEIDSIVAAGIIKAQSSVNSAEASSIFKFVSYARAVLLYVCIAVFVYSQVLVPGIDQIAHHFNFATPFMPVFNTDIILNLLYALLGVSAVHHFSPRKK